LELIWSFREYLKRYFLILTTISLFFIFGCENVDVISPDVSYQEYIVVRAELKAYSPFEGVTFTKTLPLNENYNIKKAELQNVTAYMRVNGTRIITLRYIQDGLYAPLDTISIEPGSTYELFAQYNNTNIYSITKVPRPPAIISASLIDNRFIEVMVRPNADEVYGAGWEIYNAVSKNLYDESSDFLTIVQPQPNDLGSNVAVDTKDLPSDYTSGSYDNLMYAQVYAFDSPYFNYFKSKNNNQPSENVFAQGGDQVSWNVYGDHVIGLFIGLAVVKYIKVN
jgi:hypothetical protein